MGDVFKRRTTQCLHTIACICIEQVKRGVFAGWTVKYMICYRVCSTRPIFKNTWKILIFWTAQTLYTHRRRFHDSGYIMFHVSWSKHAENNFRNGQSNNYKVYKSIVLFPQNLTVDSFWQQSALIIFFEFGVWIFVKTNATLTQTFLTRASQTTYLTNVWCLIFTTKKICHIWGKNMTKLS